VWDDKVLACGIRNMVFVVVEEDIGMSNNGHNTIKRISNMIEGVWVNHSIINSNIHTIVVQVSSVVDGYMLEFCG